MNSIDAVTKMNSVILFALALTGVLGAVPRITNIDPSLSWRIVGGSDAPEAKYPHQVSLQYRGYYHECGGAIVAKEWVVTAAHCVTLTNASDLVVLAGTSKLDSGGTFYQVLEIHYHENYNATTDENDIAILKVEPITYTDKVQPIPIKKEHVGDAMNVILSGWGSLSVEPNMPNNLQHISLKTTTLEYCRSRYPFDPIPIVESSLCTFTANGEGFCYGDSGGPLITDEEEPKLVGIVSWMIRPCAENYPDIYARVSWFVDWFNNICNCID